MINFIKNMFKPSKEGYMIPITVEKEPEREWVYIGDGMMEEVIRAKPGPNAQPLSTQSLKTRLEERRTSDIPRHQHHFVDTMPIGATVATSVYAGTSYDSPSYSGSSDCSVSSPSCD